MVLLDNLGIGQYSFHEYYSDGKFCDGYWAVFIIGDRKDPQHHT
jgi:hypothetical protein